MNPKSMQLLDELKVATDHNRRLALVVELEERQVSVRDIQRAGIQDYQIRHYRRVAKKTNAEVMEMFNQGKLSFSILKVLASAPESKQEALARNVLSKHWSVHKLRDFVTHDGMQAKFQRDMERLGEQLSEVSGLTIEVVPDQHNHKAGTWTIRYEDLDMFDQIKDIFLQGKKLDF